MEFPPNPPTVIDVGDDEEEEEEEEPFLPCGEGDIEVYSGDVHAFRSQGYPERPVSGNRRYVIK